MTHFCCAFDFHGWYTSSILMKSALCCAVKASGKTLCVRGLAEVAFHSVFSPASPGHSCPRPFVSGYCPYLSTLVSANLLFMMPRAPTPPENPFCLELELDWRGFPMAISESCFCMMARLTCRQ